jgi:prepilin-type processing-associated H-X9-DG protein
MAASPPVAGAPLPPAGYTGAMPPSPPMSPVGYATPGQELKTSGMAIASLVCGILFCVPFSSILAIVFGIIGITQTKPGQAKGRGMAIAGTVLGGLYLVLLLPLSIAILLPSLNKARETANRAKCASNMHQIGLAILLYQNDNRQEYPPDLTTLWKNEQLNGSVFVCPSSNDTPATTPDQLNSGGHLSYVYIKPTTTSADANTVVLYENSTDHAGDGMNMLFGDGHAEWESAANAKQLVDQATAAAARH